MPPKATPAIHSQAVICGASELSVPLAPVWSWAGVANGLAAVEDCSEVSVERFP